MLPKKSECYRLIPLKQNKIKEEKKEKKPGIEDPEVCDDETCGKRD